MGDGGYVYAYSEPSHSSTFKVYLPANGSPPSEEDWGHREAPICGQESILVVDDEELVRSLAKDILESHGYRGLLAENRAEAIEIYGRQGSNINLVVLDMVMPKMGERETFIKLKEINPNVKAILSSGYSQNGKAREILDSGVKVFVQKPYNANMLLSKVRSVLDNSIP